MAKTNHSATIILRLAVDVRLADDNLRDALDSAATLTVSDLVSFKSGVTLNDVEQEIVSIQSAKWL
jgi:hypothetical protein